MALITNSSRGELVALVIGMFNAAPGENYLNQLVLARQAGMSFSDIADLLATTSQFGQVYPALQTAEEFADSLISNLIPEVTDAGALDFAKDWIVSKLNSGMSRADVIVTALQAINATEAPAYADAKVALANRIEVAEYYSVEKGQSSTNLLDLQSVISNVTSDTDTVTDAKENIDANLSGEEFTLSITGDLFEGNEGNDKIFGNAQTVSALDDIDGAGGVDTLTVLGVNQNGAATAIDFSLAKVANVENLVVVGSTAGVTGADFTSWTGLSSATFTTQSAAALTVADTTEVSLTNSTAAAVSVTGGNDVSVTNGAGTITVTGVAGLANVTTSGGTTVDISDAGKGTLTTASISGNTGATTIAANKLTDLTLANSTQDATVTAAAGTRVLDLTVNKLTGGVITDAQATTVNISTTGTASSGLTLTTVKATAVTIDADVALTLADVNLTAAKTLTVTGDSKVTISATTDVAALTSIDASATTGGMTITPTLGVATAYTGGTGVDTLKLGAHTKAVALGEGNDVVTITAAMGTGGTVAGGDGTDTVIFDGAAVSLSGITGFETLGLGANATGAYVATGFTGLTLGPVAAAASFGSVAAGTGLTITGAPAFGVTYTLANAAGTSDSLPLTIKGAAAIDANTITATGVETIAITSDDTAATATNITHTVAIAGNDAKTITVVGDAGLVVTAGTAITSLDASGMTNSKVGVNYVTAALAAVATITGSAGADVIDATLAVKGVNVMAGAGNDMITIGASTGLSTINVGEGTDTVILGGIQSAAGFYTSVTGMAAGDKIDLSAVGTIAAEATLGAKITLGGAATFANYLDAAVADNASGAVNWFQLGGNTYVTVDNSATATYADGVDSVIELVGLVDLSTSVVAAEILTLV